MVNVTWQASPFSRNVTELCAGLSSKRGLEQWMSEMWIKILESTPPASVLFKTICKIIALADRLQRKERYLASGLNGSRCCSTWIAYMRTNLRPAFRRLISYHGEKLCATMWTNEVEVDATDRYRGIPFYVNSKKTSLFACLELCQYVLYKKVEEHAPAKRLHMVRVATTTFFIFNGHVHIHIENV